MNGLPSELAKLCHLASMAECCGDHLWSGPALGLWAAMWMPVTRWWGEWRAGARDAVLAGPPENWTIGSQS